MIIKFKKKQQLWCCVCSLDYANITNTDYYEALSTVGEGSLLLFNNNIHFICSEECDEGFKLSPLACPHICRSLYRVPKSQSYQYAIKL